jgi:hypothetical protein
MASSYGFENKGLPSVRSREVLYGMSMDYKMEWRELVSDGRFWGSVVNLEWSTEVWWEKDTGGHFCKRLVCGFSITGDYIGLGEDSTFIAASFGWFQEWDHFIECNQGQKVFNYTVSQ